MESNAVKKKTKKKSKSKRETKLPSSINLFDKRIIYLDCPIDSSVATQVIEDLLKLDSTNHKEIKMYINSEGGMVSAGLAIYDVMNMIKSPISTLAIGRVCSMATLLLSNGNKGNRFILPNAQTMIHQVAGGAFGKVSEMQEKVEQTNKLNQRLIELLSQNTGQNITRIKKDCLKDKWFNSSESLEYGLVDEILN